MESFTTKIDQNGRVFIPSQYRKAMGIKTGNEIIGSLEDGEIRLATHKQKLLRAQALVRKYIKTRKSLSAELIKERCREAAGGRRGS